VPTARGDCHHDFAGAPEPVYEMQGEDAFDRRGPSPDENDGSPGRGCTSSADGCPGCSTVLIDSPVKSTKGCSRAPPGVGARSGDGKTRRYVRSSEPRLKWSEELHQRFMVAAEKLGGADSECKHTFRFMDLHG